MWYLIEYVVVLAFIDIVCVVIVVENVENDGNSDDDDCNVRSKDDIRCNTVIIIINSNIVFFCNYNNYSMMNNVTLIQIKVCIGQKLVFSFYLRP